MSSIEHSKNRYLPIYVVIIATFFLTVDMFTEFTITEEMVSIVGIILAPIGLGGLVKHGFDTYKQIKNKPS